MCCLRVETETLLANCLSSATPSTEGFSGNQLRRITELLSSYFNSYIFSDVSNEALEKVVKQYPTLFSMTEDYKVFLRKSRPNLEYFNFGYQSEIVCAIQDISKSVSTTK